MADITAPRPPVPPAVSDEAPAASTGRRRAAIPFVAVVCTGAGVVLFVIGGTDATTAATLPSKVFGAGLAIVGVALLATAGGLRSERAWPGTAGSAALGAGAVLSGYLAVGAVEEERRWALAFAVLALGCSVALVVLVRERKPDLGIKSASVLSVAGFAFTFFQFTYAQSAPTRVGSTIVLTPDVVPVGGARSPGTVSVTITAANETGAKVQSLGSLYVLEGVKLCERTRAVSDEKLFEQAFASGSLEDSYSAAFAEKSVTAVQAGKVFEDGTYFEPGEEIVRRLAVPVPDSAYDVLRLRVLLAVANGDRLQLGEVTEAPAPYGPASVGATPVAPVSGRSGVRMTWGVSETSLVGRITQGDRRVVVQWKGRRGEEVAPRLEAYVAPAGDDETPDYEMSESYGLAYVSSYVDLPVVDRSESALPPNAIRDRVRHDPPEVACRRDRQ